MRASASGLNPGGTSVTVPLALRPLALELDGLDGDAEDIDVHAVPTTSADPISSMVITFRIHASVVLVTPYSAVPTPDRSRGVRRLHVVHTRRDHSGHPSVVRLVRAGAMWRHLPLLRNSFPTATTSESL